MQQLAKAAVVGRRSRNVAQGRGVLPGGPTANFVRRGKLRRVDINYSSVRRAKIVSVRESLGINFLRQHQSVATGFREADQLFKPRGPGGFEVYTSVESLHRGVNGGID